MIGRIQVFQKTAGRQHFEYSRPSRARFPSDEELRLGRPRYHTDLEYSMRTGLEYWIGLTANARPQPIVVTYWFGGNKNTSRTSRIQAKPFMPLFPYAIISTNASMQRVDLQIASVDMRIIESFTLIFKGPSFSPSPYMYRTSPRDQNGPRLRKTPNTHDSMQIPKNSRAPRLLPRRNETPASNSQPDAEQIVGSIWRILESAKAECCVCFRDLRRHVEEGNDNETNDIVIAPCGHVLCIECAEWMKSQQGPQQTCPKCKQPITRWYNVQNPSDMISLSNDNKRSSIVYAMPMPNSYTGPNRYLLSLEWGDAMLEEDGVEVKDSIQDTTTDEAWRASKPFELAATTNIYEMSLD